MSNSERRDVKAVFNKYLISDIKFNNINYSKLINILLNKEIELNTSIYFDTKLPNNYYNLFDNFFNDKNHKYFVQYFKVAKDKIKTSYGKFY